MSGGQQGGPMMGGGKGGTQQMPAGGGKGGPQGHMMPNGQRQTRPGGPPPGRQGYGLDGPGFHATQQPQVAQWHGGGPPRHQNVANVNPVGQPQGGFTDQFGGGGFESPVYTSQDRMPNRPQNPSLPQSPIGTMPSMVKPQHSGGLPPSPMATPPRFANWNPVGQPQANFGMPQSPQRQLTPMSGLLAKLYGG